MRLTLLRFGNDGSARSGFDLPANALIPRVDATQFALIKPKLDAFGLQRLAKNSRCLGILRCVTKKDCAGHRTKVSGTGLERRAETIQRQRIESEPHSEDSRPENKYTPALLNPSSLGPCEFQQSRNFPPGHRYLVGASGGADFALFVMLSKPQLFQGYVADSPFPLGFWNIERDFAASGRTVDGLVSISSSENEWTEYRKWIPMFYERMKRDGIVKGGVVYRETPGVRHTAGVSEAYMRGLMYVMEPLAPEKGVATDQFAELPGKRSFMVSFWIPKTTASPEAVGSVRRDREAFMAKLVEEKRAVVEHLDSASVPDSAGALVINAASRAEVVATVSEDPAVKAKMLEFEVLGE